MFYLLNKPKGISSFAAIKQFAKQNQITKIGHTGTLDPLASGLLLVATDDDTRLIDFIDKGDKSYIASMKLGVVSDTYDSTGVISEVGNIPSSKDVLEALKSFERTFMQMPPAFSAKKINGEKAYDLAREGKEVILKPSQVTIKDIKDFVETSKDEYSFEVTVSRGTYIRSLIHDCGQLLKSGAIMTELVRNRIANFDISKAGQAIPIQELLNIPILKISEEEMTRLLHGKLTDKKMPDNKYAIEINEIIYGVVEINQNVMKGIKIFGSKWKQIGK